ncbi:MAG: potassium/proton antiporter [Betaproteobacteria bacterium]
MEFANHAILIGALLVLLSIVVGSLSARTGAPLLLVFLAVGMLAGEEGPGRILFSDYQTVYLVGTMALAIILFDGGMRTHTESFHVGLWPAVSLATFGVILTAVIVGVAAAWLLELDLMKGLLIGAIIGSTDAAAVFSVLSSRGMRLKQRVGATLEIESGCNDPMAVFLTLVFIEVVRAGEHSLGWSMMWEFVWQFGLGGLAGFVGGRVLVWLLNRVSLSSGLYPLLAMAGGLVTYGTTTVWGGSGFLAIYLAGLILGNARVKSQGNILKVHDGMAWLSQISLFLMLGLLVTPSALIPTAVDALLVAIVLMVVARPMAVWLSLLPFSFPKREQVFIAWVGLRGAVPIVLALFPALVGLPESSVYFNVAFFVVLTSLVVQGWTVAPLAQALRLKLPTEHAPYYSEFVEVPGHEGLRLLGYQVTELSPAIGRGVNQLQLPAGVRVVVVFRGGKVLESVSRLEITARDLVYVITTDEHMTLLDHLFVPADDTEESEQQRFYGSFTLNGDAPLGEVADIYGVELTEWVRSQTLAQYIDRQFHRRPVVGDYISIGVMNLVVREIQGRNISKVGIVVRNR